MRRRLRFGLRAKLIAALVGIALLTANLTALYASLGLESRIESAARARLANSAHHFAEVSATVYESSGGWTPAATTTLGHLAEIDGLRLALTTGSGKTLVPLEPAPSGEPTESAPIVVNGRQVGSLVIQPSNGQLLTSEETHLRQELSRLHMVSGMIAAAIALVVALYLAFTMARPLRRVRTTAESIEHGHLDARVPLKGDDEIRAVGEAINSLADSLQREERLRQENLADLAHELRTPVMGLLGRIEAVQDGVLASDEANLESMHSEAVRLSSLLNDMSSLADAQRPALLLETETVDLATIGTRLVTAFDDRFAQKEIRFTHDLAPALVAGDPLRLEQIGANLLMNALRYTNAGGNVTLRIEAESTTALLEVSDDGQGIAESDLPLIFKRFWRGEKSRSRKTGGAGIGLAIVDELVQAHHGTIDVASELGRGSVFSVRLPLAGPHPG